jgi:hypothetical protein
MQQRCPTCGSPVIPGQRFCGGCGSQLSLSCPQCRITVSPGTRFCPNCGATLGGGPAQQSGWTPPPGGSPQQPGWGPQPGMPPQQPGWAGQQPWTQPAAPKQQSSSSRPFLVLFLFILLLGMGALAYFKTPLGETISSMLGISGSNNTGNTGGTTTDTTKPSIVSIADPSVDKQTLGPTSASIIWTTDKVSSTQVEWGTSTTYGTLTPDPAKNDPVITHSVVLGVQPNGLQPNTTYHYRVRSKNSAGETISDDKTFTTIEAPSS